MVELHPRRKALDHFDRFVAARPTVDECLAAGKALRDTLSREQHAVHVSDPARAEPLARAARSGRIEAAAASG